jgi:L-fuculose-phosphate aldolase
MKETDDYREERKEVARFMRRLYRQGLTTTSGGNISLRLRDDRIIITPSATDKGRMKWDEVGIMTIEGANLTPGLQPSIEYKMHLSIYRQKKNISAIIHAHPVFASSFTAMNRTIDTSLTAEARAICGDLELVRYALMGTEKLASLVSESIEKSEILLLENHGVLAAGKSLLQAFDRLEVLENAAKMTLIVEISGNKKPLSQERVDELDRLFR